MKKRRTGRKSHQKSHQRSAARRKIAASPPYPRLFEQLRVETLFREAATGSMSFLKGVYDDSGATGPDPMSILYALVEWKIGPGHRRPAILEITPPDGGARAVMIDAAEPATVGSQVRKLLEEERKIIPWAMKDPLGPFPIPYGEYAEEDRREWFLDALIILLHNAGRSQPEILKFLKKTAWAEKAGDLADLLKKKVRRLSEALGPKVVLPRGRVS